MTLNPRYAGGVKRRRVAELASRSRTGDNDRGAAGFAVFGPTAFLGEEVRERDCTMQTVEIVETSHGQAVPLPEEFRFATTTVSIRREGDAVILEPIKPAHWPEGFFDAIHIEDPAFARPDQGSIPPAPSFD